MVDILKEIYVWAIILCFVVFACHFEINLIFAIELSFFFICIYNFCILIQKNGADIKKEELKVNLLFPRNVLYLSGLHTIVAYLYQVICLDYTGLKTKIKESDNFVVKNLQNFGLTIYKGDNIYYSLLPHYFLNFLSILYLNRIKLVPKEIEEKINKKKLKFKKERKKAMKKPDKEKEKKPEDINNIDNIKNEEEGKRK